MKMEQTELDLRELIAILRRRLWLILLMPTVAAVTAGLISLFLLQPVYSASTTLWVIKDGTNAQLTLADVQLSRNLTKTYAEVARSRAVMQDVIYRLGLEKVTVQDLQEKLSVTPVRDTEILSFTIQDSDPVMAAKLADAVAAAFMGQIRTFMKVENVSVVDPALVPTSPIKPRKLMNVALATVLGGMAALGLAFLLEYLDTSVKTSEDVARHLNLPVIGVIPVIVPEGKAEADGRAAKRLTRTKTAVD